MITRFFSLDHIFIIGGLGGQIGFEGVKTPDHVFWGYGFAIMKPRSEWPDPKPRSVCRRRPLFPELAHAGHHGCLAVEVVPDGANRRAAQIFPRRRWRNSTVAASSSESPSAEIRFRSGRLINSHMPPSRWTPRTAIFIQQFGLPILQAWQVPQAT